MYRRIIVPLDGSAFAAQALPYARTVAKAFSAEIELFQVLPPFIDFVRDVSAGAPAEVDQLSNAGRPGFAYEQAQERYQSFQRAARRQLEEAAHGLRAEGLTVRVALWDGDPAEEIAREADRKEGSLIVMTTHGRSGLARLRLGSVTDKVTHLTSTPALVIRSPEGEALPSDGALERIILPLDGSPLAEQAIPHAVALAKALDVPVEVLQAVPSARPVAAGVQGMFESSQPGEATPPNGYLEGAAERLRLHGVRRVEATLAEADAAKAIIDAAERLQGSVVVMSTHGRSGLARLRRGSVADNVVRSSGRPVLLVRPARSDLSLKTSEEGGERR
jgi:nucleotide-binding universal stress UspA family protein